MTPPTGIDGISYLPTLLGKPREQGKHPYLYWEFHEQGKKQAVRLGSWKGIRLNVAKDPKGPIELYDLATDPGEERNVAAEHPEMVAKDRRDYGHGPDAVRTMAFVASDRMRFVLLNARM